jgi:hypothetical protein
MNPLVRWTLAAMLGALAIFNWYRPLGMVRSYKIVVGPLGFSTRAWIWAIDLLPLVFVGLAIYVAARKRRRGL